MAALIYVGESLVYRTVGMMVPSMKSTVFCRRVKDTHKAIEEYAVR
jgi:hypothetical protein